MSGSGAGNMQQCWVITVTSHEQHHTAYAACLLLHLLRGWWLCSCLRQPGTPLWWDGFGVIQEIPSRHIHPPAFHIVLPMRGLLQPPENRTQGGAHNAQASTNSLKHRVAFLFVYLLHEDHKPGLPWLWEVSDCSLVVFVAVDVRPY